jgi:PleD family two-component response regulator
MQSGGFTMIFNEVYKRMISIFPSEDVNEIFDTIDGLEFNEQKVITGYRQDWNLIWNSIFNKVQSIKGMVWLGVLFPFVENLCAVFDLQLPEVFSKSLNEILNENDKLKQVNISLDQTIKATNNKLLRCPITGLYNETFFHSLLLNEFGNEDWREIGILAFIGIDDFADYIIRFGNQEEQIVLNNLAYLLKEDFGENAVYRMDLPDFALYLKGLTRQEVVERLEKIRVKVNKGDYFLGKITISAGVAFPSEIDLNSNSSEIAANQYENLAFERLRTAQLTGKNKICSEGEKGIQTVRKGKILIADTDITNVTLLKTYFEEADLEVMTTDNGIEAKEMAIANLPDVIVSEVILHRLVGFSLREELLNNSTTKDIKTVFLSFKKDETSVKRAIQMGVTHYLSKPFLLAELLGIVESLVQDGKKWN